VRRVLKHFHGRVLLCDEVGLGKTIEAGMLLKEYLMRGMVKNVLILTPAPLVSQWREEMESKFGIEFLTTDDIEFLKNPLSFWKQRFIIASISLAKGSKHMPSVIEQFYDLVIVDEAHHLRNRNTLSWKLVNQIQKKFIFLLTATPVQNNLIELFNLITLLKPGQFKTEKFFKHEYVMRGNLRAPANKERLKELLRDVMVRNTRSAIDLKLPKRFATTVRLEPTETERDIYSGVNEYLRRQSFTKPMLNLLLREAGSSPFALKQSLLTMNRNGDAAHIIDAIDGLGDTCKGEALMRLLENDAGEKKIIFTQFIKSMDYITDLLWRHGIPCTTFRGDMTLREKDLAIARFREEVPVLVSTESGGEGRNLQFCNRLVNFDLPWNPMRIEQRIGRLHRIGQQRDVFVFNLSITGSIEDYIIEILDSKINMFEMVIGEIEPILGQLEEEGDFENLIMEIWLTSSDTEGMKDGFARLGDEIVKAKRKYLDAKAMDSEVLGEDYEA
jgi:SNF2 family DNA or RNA helicase